MPFHIIRKTVAILFTSSSSVPSFFKCIQPRCSSCPRKSKLNIPLLRVSTADLQTAAALPGQVSDLMTILYPYKPKFEIKRAIRDFRKRSILEQNFVLSRNTSEEFKMQSSSNFKAQSSLNSYTIVRHLKDSSIHPSIRSLIPKPGGFK